MRRFLIDTDTASDDAVALVMALRHPEVKVSALTIVAGNVPADRGAQNALYTAELCGSSVPVHLGAKQPLLRPLQTAESVHGSDGMGDVGLPLSGREVSEGHGADVILSETRQHPGEVTLVALGPLTNVALALLREPELAGRVRECVIMGGTGELPGNTTPLAEYNFWVDPEAAKVVFDSGMKLTLVGWDISRKYAVMDDETAEGIRSIGTPLAEFCMDIQSVVRDWARRHTGLSGFDLPDPIAMAAALDPTVATRAEDLYLTVETGGDWGRGQTVVDHSGLTARPPNTTLVREASRQRFLEMLRAAVS